jgi:hypothetical protein
MAESDEDLSYASADEAESNVQTGSTTVQDTEKVLKDLDVADKKEEEKAAMASEVVAELTVKAADDVTSTNSDGEPLSDSVPQHRDPISALDKLVDEDPSKSGWGWGNLSSWGTSVLNTAATSVTTFTNQVGEGLYQVLETVESGLVESDPDDFNQSEEQSALQASMENAPVETVISQEMVRHAAPTPPVDDSGTAGDILQKAGDAKKAPRDSDDVETATGDTESEGAQSKDSWLKGWGLPILSDVVHKTSTVVQQTVHQTTNVSKKVIGSGLDVLETIGRKTYDVLAEGDHGLKKTLEKSRENRPTLSQTLREAKELAESRSKEEVEFLESRKSNFGAQFDDFQGLVQLEALESLYSTSEGKVRGFIDMLPKDAADPLKSELVNIKKVFDAVEADSDDDDVPEQNFEKLVMDYYGKLNLNAGVQKLLTCQSKVRQLVSNCEQDLSQEDAEAAADAATRKTAKEIHQMAIQSLAEMTSCAIEHWHRVGQQLLLTTSSAPSSFNDIATELSGLTKVLCAEMSLLSAAFVNCLTIRGKDETDSSATELITGVYLESSNASGYIRNGFHLLLPVLQLAVIKAHPLFKDAEA